MTAKRETSMKAQAPKTNKGLKATAPDRIETSLQDVTIRFPKGIVTDDVTSFQFKEHQASFDRLVSALERSNLHFHVVGADPDGSFVAFTGDFNSPLFVWENFIGENGNNDENNVYACGVKMKTSTFLAKSNLDQDKLLEGLLLQSWMVQ